MKSLKKFVLIVGFTFLIIPLFSHNAFSIITKCPVKLFTNEAFGAFSKADKEFNKGQDFQNKKEFEKALICYINSFEFCPLGRTRFRIAFCLYSAKFYLAAEKVVLSGLQLAKQKRDSESHFCFLLLLADIYYEAENFDKALLIYECLSELPIDEKSSNFIERRIGEILFKIVFNP